MKDHNRHILILAGGLGTRLWPLSRRLEPKQFLCLNSNLTMLEQTVRRVLTLFPPERIWVVIKPCHLERMEDMDVVCRDNIIVEPEPRGTAAAVCLGVSCIMSSCVNATVTVLPSDHLVEDRARIAEMLDSGMVCAEKSGKMILYGIKPSRPETAYGYIETGEMERECNGHTFLKVLKFHEKPDFITARSYCDSGRFLWNGGMFTFTVGAFHTFLERYRPDMLKITRRLAECGGDERKESAIYTAFDDLSFDKAVVERMADDRGDKKSELLVTPCDFLWHDMGIWETFFSIYDCDDSGNIISENCIGMDCKGSMLLSEDGKTVIGAIGLDDMVVVAKDNAVLVCPRERLGEVGRIVERLKSRKMKDYI